MHARAAAQNGQDTTEGRNGQADLDNGIHPGDSSLANVELSRPNVTERGFAKVIVE